MHLSALFYAGALIACLLLPSAAEAKGGKEAAPACTPVPAASVEEAARKARDLLKKDDILGFETLFAEVKSQAACLDGAVSTAALASLLFDAAIVADARGTAFQPLLESITQMGVDLLPELRKRTGRPSLRDAVTGSAAATWAVPEGHVGLLLLDGAGVPATFHLVGPHVLQRVVNGVWTSAWVEDGVIPEWWLGAAKGKKGRPRALHRPRRAKRRSARRAALAGLLLGVLSGCRVLHVDARALADVNDGQPVALHVHQLRTIPEGLVSLGCAELRPSPEPPAWAADRLGQPSILSVMPDQRSTVQVSHLLAARWALVTPEWETCSNAVGWALVPLRPGTKHLRFELAERELRLPWDRATPPDGGERWKQRGYVDGQPSHVSFRAPRAMR